MAANLEAAGSARGLDGSARRGDDVLHDRQPEAGPARSARAISAVEALEEAHEVALFEAHAVVFGNKRRSCRVALDRDLKCAPGARILKRVLKQVLDNDSKHSGAKGK